MRKDQQMHLLYAVSGEMHYKAWKHTAISEFTNKSGFCLES